MGEFLALVVARILECGFKRRSEQVAQCPGPSAQCQLPFLVFIMQAVLWDTAMSRCVERVEEDWDQEWSTVDKEEDNLGEENDIFFI